MQYPLTLQVKMEDAPALLTPSGQNHGPTLMNRTLAGLLREREVENALVGLGWEKSTELGMFVCSSKTRSNPIGKRG